MAVEVRRHRKNHVKCEMKWHGIKRELENDQLNNKVECSSDEMFFYI